jgi:hypothetical protein
MIIIPSGFVFYIYIRILRKLNKIDAKIKFRNCKEQLDKFDNRSHSKSNSEYSRPHQAHSRQENSITINTTRTNLNSITVESNSLNKSSSTINKEKEVKKSKHFDLYHLKHLRYANQFILMFISLIATAFVHAIFSIRTLIPNFFVIFYYWRPVLRVYIIIAISFVPMITVYFHPFRKEFIKNIKNKFQNRKKN